MHPSLIIMLWLFAILLVQVLPPAILLPAALLALVIGGREARVHFRRLLIRSRWILLTLLLTFVFLTPGERLIPDLPISIEGVATGAEYLLRLLAVLFAVAWLVGGRPVEWLLAALWGLLETLNLRHGERFIVRLALTLRYAAGDDVHRSWRQMLAGASPEADAAAGESVLELPHQALAPGERLTAIVILLAGILLPWGMR